MTQTSKTIVFFGSGPVAASSLRLLAQAFTIEAVITKPRPPHHRGSVPVLELADTLGLKTLTAANTAELDDLFAHKPVNSDLAVLIDFGIIVSPLVIDYFPRGIINSHFSVLPEWRGADPITFSILSGQPTTGVSLMRVVPGLDEGPLIGYSELAIPKDATTPQLTDELVQLSNELLRELLPPYQADSLQAVPQTTTGRDTSYSRKLTKADSQLDWSKPAMQLEREIRAFIEWPRSRTTLGGTPVIITAAQVVPGSGAPGSIYKDTKQLGVYCAKDILVIDQLIPAGKKAMSAVAFMAGYTV